MKKERLNCEKETGCEFDKPFFIYAGITLIADGGEAPYVRLKMGDKEVCLEEAQLRILGEAINQGMKWCQKGWAPGIC